MRLPDLPLRGGCRCGATRIEIAAPPLFTAACHCRGCQRMSASAFSLTIAVPEGGFRVTSGEVVIGGLKGPSLHHCFCPACLSWMFTRIPGMEFVNVRPTMLDDPSWFTPFIETCIDDRLPWATTPARRSYPGFPPEADFGRLLGEFAAELE